MSIAVTYKTKEHKIYVKVQNGREAWRQYIAY